MTNPVTDSNAEVKKQKSILNSIDGFLKVSKSIYAVVAAIAAIILASKSDAKQTRFTIFVISRMWVEVIFIACCWCVYMMLRYTFRSERLKSVSMHPTHLLDLRIILMTLLLFTLLVSLIPPMYYLSQSRYHFWSSQILTAYVDGVEKKIDQQSGQGELNTALGILTSAKEVLKGSSQQDQLEGRRYELAAAVNRSRELDQSTINSWNFVTERTKWFALIEAVRINPENSSAADRLQAKLTVVRDALASDTQKLCASKELPVSFSGRAVALIEARSLWYRYGSGDQCTQHVQADLYDGWGIEPTVCILKRNREIRQRTVESDTASCPPGVDFWTPLPASDEDTSDYAAFSDERSLSYPTVVGLYQKWRSRQRAKAEYQKFLEHRARSSD